MADISVTLKTGTNPVMIETLKKWSAGDFGSSFNFTIKDSEGTAINLTGITPMFVVYNFKYQVVLEKECTVVTPASGTCKYTTVIGLTKTSIRVIIDVTALISPFSTALKRSVVTLE